MDLFVVNKKKPEKRQNGATMGRHNLYVRVRVIFSRTPTAVRRHASRTQRDIRPPECLRQLHCVLVNDGVGCSPAKQCRRSARSVAPNRSAVGSVPLEPFLKLYLFEQKIGHQAAKT